jgi:ATP-dependent helicase HrpA
MLIAQEMARTAASILAAHAELQKKLAQAAKTHPQTAEDVKQQLSRLLRPGWLRDMPWARLQHFPRYLKAAALRLEKLRADPARDARLSAELQPLLAAWLRAPRPLSAELEQFGWLLEELRVSLYAQELKTPVPVSAKRLAKLWQSIRR